MAIFTFDQAVKKAGVKPEDVKSVGLASSTEVKKSVVNPTSAAPGVLSQIGSDFAKRGQDIVDQTTATKQNIADAGGSTIAKLAGTGEVAGRVAGETAGAVINAGLVAGKALVNKLNGDNGEQLTAAGDQFMKAKNILGETNAETLAKVGNLIKDGVDNLPPNVVQGFKNFFNTIGLMGGGKVLNAPVENIVPAIKDAASAIGTGVKDIAAGADITGAVNKAGTALKTAGEAATGVGVTMEAPTKLALQAYESNQPSLLGRVKNFLTGEEAVGTKPITEANTAARLGLNGTEWQLGVQGKKISSELFKNTIQPALNESKAVINKTEFFNNLKKRIIAETPDLTRRSTLLEALQSFADDYKKVNNFGLPKLQQYKEGWAKFVPEKAYKDKPIAGALNDVRNMAAQDARQIIYDNLGNDVKTAYLDYGNLQSIADQGIKSVDALRSKGVSRQVWEAILDKAVTPVATFAGKVLYKTGTGLELVGKTGAKTLRDIVK